MTFHMGAGDPHLGPYAHTAGAYQLAFHMGAEDLMFSLQAL